MDTPHRYVFFSVPLFSTLILLLASCSSKSVDAPADTLSGPSGTLSYKGVVSGSVTFQSADCTFDKDRHIVAFEAPHQDNGHPEIRTPGPYLGLGFFDPDSTIFFSTDHEHGTDQNEFMQVKHGRGASYEKKGDKWMITINGWKIPSMDILDQQWVALTGTLVCTHLINPRLAQ